MAVTPVKARAAAKPASSGKKQLSLMSFFKPQPTTQRAPPQSSPVKSDSDKENDDASAVHSTPLTSDCETLEPKSKPIDSSPLKRVNQKPRLTETEPSATAVKSEPVTTPLTSSFKRRAAAQSVSSYVEPESEDEDSHLKAGRKRRRIVESDDDDDDEFKMDSTPEEEDDDMSDFVVPSEDEDDKAEIEEDDVEKKLKRKASPRRNNTATTTTASSEGPMLTTSSAETSLLGKKFDANSSYSASASSPLAKSRSTISKASATSAGPFGRKNFTKENEERYQWLINIKDAQKRPTDDPEYDSRTLYVPQSAWAKFTNFEKQYWEIKSKMWDTVVFFKKGKFYELYEKDAMIANSKFDLKIAGGGRANMQLAGIPEMSFDYWAKEFISNGYKVAKVDQVESMLAKEMRGNVKEEKIIKRELTSVLTGGTLTDLNMITDDMSIYCLSIRQEANKFGLAFVDTSTSELQIVELEEDNMDECSKLNTIITQIKPKEIICEKGNLSAVPMKILKHSSPSGTIIWNYLNPGSEAWDYETTLEELVKSNYYEAKDLDDYTNYPPVLLRYKNEHEVAFTAFGSLLYYLKELKLDQSVMTMQNIHEYDLLKQSHSATNLLLDGITLSNLEILNNSFDGTDRGTLFKLMNRAITPFGRRVLKNWVLNPLFKVSDINQRYDAVEYLMENREFRDVLERGLSDIPDLERMIARVHGKTLRFKDFVKVIEGFERIDRLIEILRSYELTEAQGVLYGYVTSFPAEMSECIGRWGDAFDRDQAVNDVIVPATGMDAEFDNSLTKMSDLEAQLGVHLKAYKREYKSQEICFRDSGKEIFLIELPIKIKNVPNDWQQMGATSKVKRFWSPEVKKLVRQLMEQRELHKMLCETLRSRMYEKFDVDYQVWIKSIRSLAQMDCLVALAKTSESIGFPSCRPLFRTTTTSELSFEELRHPCFLGNTCIPNDVVLGGTEPTIGLLTGANAAGKSTLMRTTALAVILSQVGCFVPAKAATLTPVDKIMTRLGANDNIMQGKSTFFVELSETKKIIDNATPRSLVIIDELGRGGSSSDGYAIAESVLYHLATHIQSLGFFATHYGTLGLSFKTHPKVKPLRMAIIVDQKVSRNITFLYKLEDGAASSSFGMNVASMCGIPENIVVNAEAAAKEYEHTSKLKKLTDKMEQSEGADFTARLGLGLQSDFVWLAKNENKEEEAADEATKLRSLNIVYAMIDAL